VADQNTQNDNDRPQLPSSGGRGRYLLWIIFGTLAALWAWSFYFAPGGGERISYTMFNEQIEEDNVEQVTIQGTEVNGTLRTPALRPSSEGDSTRFSQFITYLPESADNGELIERVRKSADTVSIEPKSSWPWGAILLALLPIVLLVGIGYIFLRRMQAQGQGLFSVRKSKAKLFDKDEENTTFDDVAGCDGAKEELKEVITFLKNPERFERLGGEVPKGVLLVGPPGTGKTLLARAVAGEADAPFYSVSGSDFMEMFVGVGASRVRDMFEEAKENAPAIIFVDELDSIGRQRGAGVGGGHDEREQTLNQLLSELDGFEKSESVVVMAATNRPDILDPALTRPGRFDRRITVDLPMKPAREEILRIHAKNKPLADDVDMERVAKNTPGFSGADLENLLNEAALLAGRHNHDYIEQADIEEARDKVMMGLKREGIVLTDEERKMLAYHEAGHAIVAAALPNADPVHKVTIIPRGKAMGVTQQMPEKDKYLYLREYVVDRLAVAMGGRAAEELIFDTATSGAENDLKQVRKMARKMVLDWGMGENFKHIAMGEDQGNVFLGEELSQGRDYSDETAREIDDEVRRITEMAFKRAIDTLREHRDAFDQLADALIENEEVAGEKVLALIGGDRPENGEAVNGAATEAATEDTAEDADEDGAEDVAANGAHADKTRADDSHADDATGDAEATGDADDHSESSEEAEASEETPR
jgi:cell division protease FtsH